MEGTAVEHAAIAAEASTNGRVGMPASAVKAKLYGLRGSAPSFSAELMLLHKGINYRRVNMIAGLHRRRLPAKGFPGRTVPAMVLNGRLVQTNRAIAQPAVRRMILWSMGRDPDSVRPHPENGRLSIPRSAWLRARLMPRVFKMWGITDEVVRKDFEALPAMLDKLDAYVADGVLDNHRLTAADLEIAPLIGALLGIADLGAEVGQRPVARLASRVLPR